MIQRLSTEHFWLFLSELYSIRQDPKGDLCFGPDLAGCADQDWVDKAAKLTFKG